ncbi:M20 family peptidase [Clostridiales bacterium COT073_COT-073]|nr:M20 family peptidase [Clostridiales bacterium COT073_COT-073]
MNKYEQLAKEFLQEIIAFETVNPPGAEAVLARRIAEIMEGYGFQTEIQAISEGRANVIIRLGDHPNKIIFNGHLDVVPAGDGWKHQPFAVTEEGGRFYGRGTCDMKGAVAAMMAMAVKLKQENSLKDQELLLVFVADEEVSGQGSKAFTKTFAKGNRNWVIIGEPTSNHIHVGHRGIARLKVTLKGIQCHAGQPARGINANTLMAKFLLEVDALNQRMQDRKQAILPPPNISATKVNGGIKDNVIPGECQAILDIRTVPGDTSQKLIEEVESILSKLFGEEPNISWTVEGYIEVAPGITAPDHALVRTAAAAIQKVQAEAAKITYFDGCCDMSYFLESGFEGIICGPGSLDQAHTLDEYLSTDEFYQAIAIYEAIVLETQANGL